jgi:hypothetical protein
MNAPRRGELGKAVKQDAEERSAKDSVENTRLDRPACLSNQASAIARDRLSPLKKEPKERKQTAMRILG